MTWPNRRILIPLSQKDLEMMNKGMLSTHKKVFDLGSLGAGKGKAVPLQAWSGSEGSRKLRFPNFTTTAHPLS